MAPSPLRLGAFALVVAFALSACGDAKHPAAAVVNGDRITDGELETNLPLYRFLATQGGTRCGQPEGRERPAAACVRFVLSRLITEHVVLPFARAHGVAAPAAELAGLQRRLAGNPQVQELEDGGVTRADIRSFLSRLLVVRDAQLAVARQTVSDADLRALYEQNQAEFTQIHVAHILVPSRSEAERLARIATPGDFARLAKEHSTDVGSKDQGGDLGFIPATQLDPAFVRAALALPVGDISDAVHTRFGWHVIRLLGKRTTPFEEARPQLLQQFAGQAFQRWLAARLREADVEVNPRYGRFDPSTGQVVSICSTATSAPEGDCTASTAAA